MLVTGASSGIGRAIALAAARAGADVALTYRSNEKGARAVELRFLHSDGTRVLWFSQTAVPLRDEAGHPAMAAFVIRDAPSYENACDAVPPTAHSELGVTSTPVKRLKLSNTRVTTVPFASVDENGLSSRS